MLARTRLFHAFVGVSAVAVASMAWTQGLAADGVQEAPIGENVRAPVTVVAESTQGGVQPHARVRLDRPGYLALFEVHPDIGATLIYPHDLDDQERLSSGTRTIRLDGLRTALHRRLMFWHLETDVALATFEPFSHLVAVVSDRPIRSERLLSGRVFEAPHAASRDAGDVTRALLAEVAPGAQGTDWHAATTSFRKFLAPAGFAASDPALSTPFLVTQADLRFFGQPFAGVATLNAFCRHELAAALFSLHASPGRHAACGGIVGRPTLVTLVHGPSYREAVDRPELGAPERQGDGGSSAGAGTDAGPEEEFVDELPREAREALRRIADATERLGPRDDGARDGLDTSRRLESLGETLNRRGLDTEVDRLREIRRRTETRTRRQAESRMRRQARGFGSDRFRARSQRPHAGFGNDRFQARSRRTHASFRNGRFGSRQLDLGRPGMSRNGPGRRGSVGGTGVSSPTIGSPATAPRGGSPGNRGGGSRGVKDGGGP